MPDCQATLDLPAMLDFPAIPASPATPDPPLIQAFQDSEVEASLLQQFVEDAALEDRGIFTRVPHIALESTLRTWGNQEFNGPLFLSDRE
jgi:hypothetical protein